MSKTVNRQVLLKSRPSGEPTEANFALVEAPVPEPGPGQFVARTIYLSLDPYMRGRMSEGPSYASPAALDEPMVGGTVGQVVSSRLDGFAEGDFVVGYWGWQEYGVSTGAGVRKLDPAMGRLSYALGVLGMPGMTAYVGLLDIGQPKPGETVVVSAASGAVGSVVGQIARIKGCRAVGIAGGAEKCRHLTEDLGFDASVDYKAANLDESLKTACPKGIDVYYENVGGKVFDAVFKQINTFARIPLIGLISQYNATALAPGPNLMPVLVKRALIQGMIVGDHADREADFLRDVSGWLKEGKITYREDIVEGIDKAPRAFLGLFKGENRGKLIVKVGDDPTTVR
jgi:NADPH-dependent curcumin reductase CurA